MFLQKKIEEQGNNSFLKLYHDVFSSIKKRLLNSQIECSGAIFENGTYSFYQGQIDRVKVASYGDILWHSHPDGELTFSLQDWLCFFYSPAEIAALFSNNKILVIRKNSNCKRLRPLLIKEAENFKGYPSVVTYKFIKTIESYFSIDLSETAEEKLLSCFKIDFEIIEIE